MTRNKSVLILGLLVTGLLSFSTAAIAPVLKFTFKSVVVKSATETDSYGINNAGKIAGDYVDSAGNQHGLVLAGKTVRKIDITDCGTGVGTTGISFYAINNENEAAGWCTSVNTGQTIGFVWSKGKVYKIAYPTGVATQAIGINDAGEVVGDFVDSAGTQHAFLWATKKYTKLPDPPNVVGLAQAWSINNTGEITIFGVNSSNTYLSFTTKNRGKKYTAYHAPNEGSTGTAIHAINNKGDFDSTVFDTSGNRHGVLRHGGKDYTFDDPNGVNATRADGLNDKLEIVGRYSPTTGGNDGFYAKAK